MQKHFRSDKHISEETYLDGMIDRQTDKYRIISFLLLLSLLLLLEMKEN